MSVKTNQKSKGWVVNRANMRLLLLCAAYSVSSYSNTLSSKDLLGQEVKNTPSQSIIEAYANDLVAVSERYERAKHQPTRGVPLSVLRDVAVTFTIAYDLKDKGPVTVFFKTHPKVEKGAYFLGGAFALYGVLWFKKFMHL